MKKFIAVSFALMFAMNISAAKIRLCSLILIAVRKRH